MFEFNIKKLTRFTDFKWYFNLKKFIYFKGIEITLFGIIILFKEKNFFNKIGTASFCYNFN